MQWRTAWTLVIPIIMIAIAAGDVRADEPPLVGIEAKIGSGLAVGGGVGESAWRKAPTTTAVLAEFAIRSQPWTTVFGSLILETDSRLAAGGTVGLRVHLTEHRIRAGAGITVIATPLTAFGPTVTIGKCRATMTGRVCLDFESTILVGGSDLPAGRLAAMFQLALGIGFDVM